MTWLSWERRARGETRRPAGRGSRKLPLVVLASVCVTAVVAAVTVAAKPVDGLQFVQPGHWVANPQLGKVFHVNGTSSAVDAQGEVAGIEPGSQVVQGPTSGYVVGSSRIIEFGKSSLSVQRELNPPAEETPVAVEAAGGPYLVYRDAGRAVRLGDDPVTVHSGGSVGRPVVTADGTLWLHRQESGELCQLPKQESELSCTGAVAAGHDGGLSTSDGAAVFVDTTSDEIVPVDEDGPGTPRPVGADLPGDARIGTADAGGRIPVLEESGRRMHLVDTGAREPGKSVTTVPLPGGDYAGPETSGDSVVLLDNERRELLVFSANGERQKVEPLPGDGDSRLARGEDQRVYVDDAAGENVLVVDEDRVNRVDVVASGEGPDDANAAGQPGLAAPPEPQRPPPAPPQPPEQRSETRTSPRPPPPPPQPATPPGIPQQVAARAENGAVVATWAPAASNGAPVTAYHVSWQPLAGAGGGATVRPGDARSALTTDVAPGSVYRVTVTAENDAGRGAAASTVVSTPEQDTRSIKVARGQETSYGDCQPPSCAFPYIEMTGFEPNTTYEIVPFASEWGRYNSGAALSTDGNGTLIVDDQFPFDGVGQQVWVVVEDVESNRVNWEVG